MWGVLLLPLLQLLELSLGYSGVCVKLQPCSRGLVQADWPPAPQSALMKVATLCLCEEQGLPECPGL